MKCKIALLLSCIFLLFYSQTHAQNTTVSGKVTNKANGELLYGATVRVKGSQVVTTTDATGSFKLTVPSNGSALQVTDTACIHNYSVNYPQWIVVIKSCNTSNPDGRT